MTAIKNNALEKKKKKKKSYEIWPHTLCIFIFLSMGLVSNSFQRNTFVLFESNFGTNKCVVICLWFNCSWHFKVLVITNFFFTFCVFDFELKFGYGFRNDFEFKQI